MPLRDPTPAPQRPSPFSVRTMRNRIRSLAASFAQDEKGATTAEYGIIIVVVAGIAIFVLSQLNGVLDILYDKFGTKVNTVN